MDDQLALTHQLHKMDQFCDEAHCSLRPWSTRESRVCTSVYVLVWFTLCHNANSAYAHGRGCWEVYLLTVQVRTILFVVLAVPNSAYSQMYLGVKGGENELGEGVSQLGQRSVAVNSASCDCGFRFSSEVTTRSDAQGSFTGQSERGTIRGATSTNNSFFLRW